MANNDVISEKTCSMLADPNVDVHDICLYLQQLMETTNEQAESSTKSLLWDSLYDKIHNCGIEDLLCKRFTFNVPDRSKLDAYEWCYAFVHSFLGKYSEGVPNVALQSFNNFIK